MSIGIGACANLILQYIEEGLIVIENCSNCWKTTDDEKHIDVMALNILIKLFRKYQEQGSMPECISYDVQKDEVSKHSNKGLQKVICFG